MISNARPWAVARRNNEPHLGVLAWPEQEKLLVRKLFQLDAIYGAPGLFKKLGLVKEGHSIAGSCTEEIEIGLVAHAVQAGRGSPRCDGRFSAIAWGIAFISAAISSMGCPRWPRRRPHVNRDSV